MRLRVANKIRHSFGRQKRRDLAYFKADRRRSRYARAQGVLNEHGWQQWRSMCERRRGGRAK